MKAKKYNYLSEDVIKIRQMVFMEEQGFQNEFDDVDKVATHIVMYNKNNDPIATCRVFEGEERDIYILGRLAVIKQYRGNHLGSKMVEEAEKLVISKGGKSLCLHAQCRVKDFYTKLGFVEYGQEDEDEGCPHIWMKNGFLSLQIPVYPAIKNRLKIEYAPVMEMADMLDLGSVTIVEFYIISQRKKNTES